MKLNVTVSSPITIEVQEELEPTLGVILGPVRERFIAQKEGAAVAELILGDTQEVRGSVHPLDRAGNPARLDGPVTWESQNPDIIVATSVDDITGNFATTGTLGDATVVATADADLGEGVRTVTETITFHVVAGEANSLNVSFGTPVERTPTP